MNAPKNGEEVERQELSHLLPPPAHLVSLPPGLNVSRNI